MRQLFINNPRRILLTRVELYKAGHSDLIPGFDCSFWFGADGVNFSEASNILFTAEGHPELTRKLGAQIDTAGNYFRVKWSRHEKESLTPLIGQLIPFQIEYELAGERIFYGSGLLEVAPENV